MLCWTVQGLLWRLNVHRPLDPRRTNERTAGLRVSPTASMTGALSPGGFVGIDLDAARIDGFRQQRADLKWLAGNLYELLDREELGNVGVLNLNEYGEVGHANAVGDFNLIRDLVKRGLEKFGEFDRLRV